MDHEVEVIRTTNEDPAVPDAVHVRCSCGWSSSASDGDHARELVDGHVESGEAPAPPPYTPSPD